MLRHCSSQCHFCSRDERWNPLTVTSRRTMRRIKKNKNVVPYAEIGWKQPRRLKLMHRPIQSTWSKQAWPFSVETHAFLNCSPKDQHITTPCWLMSLFKYTSLYKQQEYKVKLWYMWYIYLSEYHVNYKAGWRICLRHHRIYFYLFLLKIKCWCLCVCVLFMHLHDKTFTRVTSRNCCRWSGITLLHLTKLTN